MDSYIFIDGPVLWLIMVLLVVMVIFMLIVGHMNQRLAEKNSRLESRLKRAVDERDSLRSEIEALQDKYYRESVKRQLAEENDV